MTHRAEEKVSIPLPKHLAETPLRLPDFNATLSHSLNIFSPWQNYRRFTGN